MKRSDINTIYNEAKVVFDKHGWVLPPNPKWDITDFGLGDFANYGLVLINLCEEPEYCEKLMYARPGQRTPSHTHKKKKEDIICRSGTLELQLWQAHPERCPKGEPFSLQVNGEPREHANGDIMTLQAGERITLTPGIYHEFWAGSPETIIGEVSTANDDLNDNFFVKEVGRFPGIDEDESPAIKLLSDV